MDKHHLYFGSNLKLSKGITESARFAADICALLRPEDLSSVTAFIIPSYLAIPGVRDAIGAEGPLMFGAQNVCAQEQGAYEPVWAIGTAGVPASPEYAQEKHAVIRSALTRVLGPAGGRSPCCTGAASTGQCRRADPSAGYRRPVCGPGGLDGPGICLPSAAGQAQRGPELIFRPPRRPTKPIKRRRSVCSISA